MPPRSLGKSSDLAGAGGGGWGGVQTPCEGLRCPVGQEAGAVLSQGLLPTAGPPAHPWWTIVIKILDMFTVWLFHYTSKFYPKSVMGSLYSDDGHSPACDSNNTWPELSI